MRRDPILLAWGAGLLLAALVYLVGPDRFLFRLMDTLHVLGWRLAELIEDLSIVSLDLVRAEGLKVVAQCPFVKAWIDKHSDYADLLKA